MRATSNPAPGDSVLEFHPLANVFPLLDDKALTELGDDIRAHGLRDPITLFEGKILDGRNRWRACRAGGIEPRFETYIGADPVGFVASKNLHRRDLTDDQRRMAAAKLVTMGRGRPEKMAQSTPLSRERAAELMRVDVAGVKRARAVLTRASPETVSAVERGELSVAAAAKLAPEPKTETPSAAVGSRSADAQSIATRAEARGRPGAAKSKAPQRRDAFAGEQRAISRDAKIVRDVDSALALFGELIEPVYLSAEDFVRERIETEIRRILAYLREKAVQPRRADSHELAGDAAAGRAQSWRRPRGTPSDIFWRSALYGCFLARKRALPKMSREDRVVPQAEFGGVLRSNRQPVTFPDEQRNSWAQ